MNQQQYILIPKHKKELIFQFSKEPSFIHEEYTTTGKRRVNAGNPNYRKIAIALNLSHMTVRRYIKDLHSDSRKYNRIYGKNYRKKKEVKQKTKEYHKEYNQRPGVKAWRKIYSKKYGKEYNKRSEVIKRRKVYHKKYYKEKQSLNLNKKTILLRGITR
jgi:hypothetical protein